MSHPRLPEMQQSSQSPPPYSPLEHEVERDFNFLVYALGVGPSQPRAQCLHRRRTQVHFLAHEVATTPSRISEDQQLVQDQVPGSRIPSPMNLETEGEEGAIYTSSRLRHHPSTKMLPRMETETVFCIKVQTDLAQAVRFRLPVAPKEQQRARKRGVGDIGSSH